MPSLGLFLVWAGYTVGMWGFVKFKHSTLTLSDITLPSHRNAYVSAGRLWGQKSTAQPSSQAIVSPTATASTSVTNIPGTNASVGGPAPAAPPPSSTVYVPGTNASVGQ